MEKTIAFYGCLIVLAGILFPGMSLRPKNEETFFDRIATKELQGFFAVFIIFHHIVVIIRTSTPYLGLMMNYYYYGILAVAFFFFCSGFGLLKRWMSDKEYLNGFMKKRVFTVLVPYFICNYIYLTEALITNMKTHTHFSFPELIGSFFGFFLVNAEMWFAVEIMLLYIAFRLIFAKIKKPSVGILLITLVVAVIMLTGLKSGHSESNVMSYWFQGEWWYNTILMFPLGMLYAYKEETINGFIRKAFIPLTILTAAALAVCDYIHRDLIGKEIYWTESETLNDIPDKLLGLSQETIFEIVFLLFILLIMSKVRIGNPVLKALGKISLEIILTNYLVIHLLRFVYVKYGYLVYIPAVIAGTLLAAAVIYMIKNIVLERKTNFFDGKIQ
ncbi:MAG: acyltransferase [Saccharofermentans sp.]|nr:acyltransferase [Saccharofermentans sp.]